MIDWVVVGVACAVLVVGHSLIFAFAVKLKWTLRFRAWLRNLV